MSPCPSRSSRRVSTTAGRVEVSSGGARGYDLNVSTASALRTDAGGGVRRLGWGLADQALSSLTNFALAILVARTVSTSALGAFGLAFTTYTITLGATRALCSEPLTVRYSATGEREWREGASAATGVALVLGAIAGVLCIGASFLFGGTLRPSLIVLGAEHARPDRAGHLAQRLLLPPARDVRLRERPGLGDRPGGPGRGGAGGRPAVVAGVHPGLGGRGQRRGGVRDRPGGVPAPAAEGALLALAPPRPRPPLSDRVRRPQRRPVGGDVRDRRLRGPLGGGRPAWRPGRARPAQHPEHGRDVARDRRVGADRPPLAAADAARRDDPRGRRSSSCSSPGASPCTCCRTRSARCS